MKRGTPEHPKMMMLASLLSIEKWGAVGIMESVWHFTAKYAPQGDIGKYSDEMIAAGIGWTGDATKLISAIIDAQWADKSAEFRLVIHDWHEHSDDYADKYLARNGLTYANGMNPRRAPDNTGKKRKPAGQGRTRADKSRVSVSVSESVSVSPPISPKGDQAGERGRSEPDDFLVEWLPLQRALVGTGKCPGVTREMLKLAFAGVEIGPAEVDYIRLFAEGQAGSIGALMPWLRKRAQEIQKKNKNGGADDDGPVVESRNAPVNDEARRKWLEQRRKERGEDQYPISSKEQNNDQGR